ncbi:hypothetical protein TNCV_1056171 [Trichonephila clavipes]|nr:hypothetical protein TNCV_1056171 [Trichonephila clavipes]
MQVIRKLDTGERQSQISAALKLKTSTIRTILKNKEKILSSTPATTTNSATRITRSRNNTIEEIENRLSIRIDDEIERKMPLSQSTFLIKWQKIGNTEERLNDLKYTELTPASIFDCPAISAALQEVRVLFSSTNLYVDNTEQIARAVIWTHGTVPLGPIMDTTSSSSLNSSGAIKDSLH